MVKKIDRLSPMLPWEDISHPFFERDTLIFTLFYVNPVMSLDNQQQQLEQIYDKLQAELSPWISHFAWSCNPLRLSLAQHNGQAYVYGELVYGDTLDDEWLVCHLLTEFLRTEPDVFVHFFDSEGEFLLVEAAEGLPEWLEPETAMNRVWVNQGRITVIPDTFYPDRGLRLAEALTFVTRATFRLQHIPEIHDIVAAKLAQYPRKSLGSVYSLACNIDPKVAQFLAKYPHLVSLATTEFFKNNLTPKRYAGNVSKVSLQFPFLAYSLVKRDLSDSSTEERIPPILYAGLDEVLSQDESLLAEFQGTELAGVATQDLQDILLYRNVITERIPENHDTAVPENPTSTNEEEDLMARFETFFRDTSAQGAAFGLSKSDKSDLESDGEDEDVDQEAAAFFKSEDIDIDEDDFFEYFCQEALGLKQEEIAAYMTEMKGSQKRKIDDEHLTNNQENSQPHCQPRREYNNESDYASSEEDYEVYDADLGSETGENDMLSSLANLVKSIKADGGISGPGATMFQGIGVPLPRDVEDLD
ncbi:hypothetical protein BABINDRAFT_159113 [Babjeviella inositovora NRRL Y-12698]|uniref:Uncharacterized protein n=1 Tax=Babjeviella inositovora NRRL Y-12698 TaxID=984486 RepID=A0A1E3QY06_9ASCO|nr:uncharacterized protein BABINDRAFT_159113 [Babjeviella inositovora NRRL Y-12698]ODQ82549.1 hypothetical protein BABINDRAFT_159113 [Babjeviella inositovora NRRL Y-12698]